MAKRNRNAVEFLKGAVLTPRIIRISGDEGVGKSSLALTATAPEADNPDLMFVFDWDQGLERAHKALTARTEPEYCHIYTYGFEPGADVTENDMADAFGDWQDDFAEACAEIEENKGGVIVLDTESHWTDIVTLVKTNEALRLRIAKRRNSDSGDGVSNNVQRLDYGLRNAFIEKTVLNMRGLPNARFVMITRLGPVFEGAQDTGRKAPKGYKDMNYMVELDLRLRRNTKGDREVIISADKFVDSNTGKTMAITEEGFPDLLEDLYSD